MASEPTIAKVLVILSSAYPRVEIPEVTPAVYADLLGDLDDNLLIAAAQHHATRSKWFPSIAELREAAYHIQALSSGLPDAGDAWAEVKRQISFVGHIGKPEWSTPLIGQAVDALGGWRSLCLSENEIADRAHFLKIYKTLLMRHRDDGMMLPQVRDTIGKLAEMKRPQLEGDKQ